MERNFYSRYRELEERHWWFLGRRAILLGILESHLSAGANRRLLDAGCGTGGMLRHLQRFGQVWGVDMDQEAVNFCRQDGFANVHRVESGQALPFDDASFDVVTAFDVIEHVDDDAAMLADLNRILRPGGLLLVTVPAFEFLWGLQDEVSHHKRRYGRRQLVARIEAAGLSVDRVSYFNTLLFLPIAAVRVLRRIRRRPPKLESDFDVSTFGRLNSLLAWLFALEARVMRQADLPVGVSLLGIAHKPAHPRRGPASQRPRGSQEESQRPFVPT